MLGVPLFVRAIALSLLIVTVFQVGYAYAEVQTLVDSTVVVPNLNYYTFTREIIIDDMESIRIEGTITVSDGSINVYLMERSGYEAFRNNGQTDMALYSADNVQTQTLSVQIVQSGTYYFVLENSDLLASKTVQVQLQLAFERPSQRFLTYAALVVVGIAIAVGTVLVVRRMRRKGPAAAQVLPSVGAEPVVPKYCVHCGALMHQMARTCPACGRDQKP
jgi:hypothetical protein